MKNILITIYTYTLGGGAEKILKETVNNLDKDKYKITVLPYAYYGVKIEDSDDNITVLPSVVNMVTSNPIERWIKYFLVHFFPSVIRRIYIKEKYDAEISFNYQIPSFMVKKRKYNKVINWNHGDIYDLEKSWLKRKLQERSFKQADIIVAISENTKQSIQHIFPQYADKIKLIYNGIDTEKNVVSAKESTEIKVKDNSLVFLGRLEEMKKPLKLLEYVKATIDSGRDIKLYFLGQGEQSEAVRQKISEYGLQDKVFQLGYVSNPCPIISQCKAVCMLSKTEGFPTVFAEGMSLGVPFITTNVGGVKELSNDGKCGVIVDTVKEFIEAVDKVVLDTKANKEMSKACIEHIKNFSVSRQIQEIEALLDN